MLLGALSTEEVQAIQAVLLAGIAAYVAVRTRQIDATAREAERKANDVQRAAGQLDERVSGLESHSGTLRRSPPPPPPPTSPIRP